jgi:fatty acid desaturase
LAVYLFHIATMFGGVALFVAFDAPWVRVPALLLSTYGAVGVSTSAHCASHGTATGNSRIDRLLSMLGFSFLLGVSELYWRHKHIRVHHGHPNDVDVDDDIDLKPFFVLSDAELAAASGLRRRLYELQHWAFPFALSLNTFNVQQTGLRHLVGELRQRRPQPWTFYDRADVACLAAHCALFLVAPSFFWPWQHVVGLYLLRGVASGYGAFVVFAPAHFPGEARFVSANRERLGVLGRQIYTTVNFRTGFFGSLVCSGVQYQIEHHLMPDVNQHRIAQASRIVEAFCRDHGYPYQTLGWWEGIVKSWLALKLRKPVYTASQLAGLAAEPSPGDDGERTLDRPGDFSGLAEEAA